jgi:hypothetical protein
VKLMSNRSRGHAQHMSRATDKPEDSYRDFCLHDLSWTRLNAAHRALMSRSPPPACTHSLMVEDSTHVLERPALSSRLTPLGVFPATTDQANGSLRAVESPLQPSRISRTLNPHFGLRYLTLSVLCSCLISVRIRILCVAYDPSSIKVLLLDVSARILRPSRQEDGLERSSYLRLAELMSAHSIRLDRSFQGSHAATACHPSRAIQICRPVKSLLKHWHGSGIWIGVDAFRRLQRNSGPKLRIILKGPILGRLAEPI